MRSLLPGSSQVWELSGVRLLMAIFMIMKNRLDRTVRSFRYTGKLARAIRKPPKVFFYDNADVSGDDGARFENLVPRTCSSEFSLLKSTRAIAMSCDIFVTKRAAR